VKTVENYESQEADLGPSLTNRDGSSQTRSSEPAGCSIDAEGGKKGARRGWKLGPARVLLLKNETGGGETVAENWGYSRGVDGGKETLMPWTKKGADFVSPLDIDKGR